MQKDLPTLETRTCKCGCLKTFRVLPKSKSFYSSITHDPAFPLWSYQTKLWFTKSSSRAKNEIQDLDDEIRRLHQHPY